MPVDGFLPLIVTPVIAVLALWRGAMSRAGALAGCAVGLAIAYGTGWGGIAMLGALLLLGTVTSDRARRGRGTLQALCNGLVAAVCALAAAFGSRWGVVASAGALAVALSDTIAGEIGQRLKGRARLLLFGPPVPAGRDGGMSWIGTAAGAAAAFVVPLVGWLAGSPFDARLVLVIAGAGFAGNVIDSVIGVVLQPRLGRWGNDWTNLIATGLGAALTLVGS